MASSSANSSSSRLVKLEVEAGGKEDALASAVQDSTLHSTGLVVGVVAIWMACNVTLGTANKAIFSIIGFKYPVFLTMCHMIASHSMSALYLALYDSDSKAPKPETIRRVWMLSVTFCLSITLNNIGLKYVFVSFYEILSACTAPITMLIAVLMQGKRFHPATYCSMLPLCGGVMLCVKGELNFHIIGFICCGTATVLRGAKSVIQGMLMSDGEKLSPMQLLFHMSRPCILFTGVWCALAEYSAITADPKTYAMKTWMMVGVSSMLAVGLNLFTFLVTFYTSAVTLQVLGQLKVVASILFSVSVFHNQISPLAAVGTCVTICGMIMYARTKSWSA